jgi:hypothetical protein
MRWFTVLALALAIGLATAVSPFASASPDGLEKVAADKGFVDRGELAPVQEGSPIRDYAVPGVDDPRLATGLAGFTGTIFVFGLGYVVALIARRERAVA